MPYTRTTWIDDVTPLTADNFNNMEQGIVDLYGRRIRADVTGITSYTFSGLDGNTEGLYEIVAHGFITHVSGADAGLKIQPNADNAGHYVGEAWRTYWDAGLVSNIVDMNAEAGQSGVYGIHLLTMNWGGNGHVFGRTTLAARDDSGGSVSWDRVFSGEYASRPMTGDTKNMHGIVGGYWNDPANANVNSLKIVVTNGTFTGRLFLNKVGLA